MSVSATKVVPSPETWQSHLVKLHGTESVHTICFFQRDRLFEYYWAACGGCFRSAVPANSGSL
jgi:hypothetical protein